MKYYIIIINIISFIMYGIDKFLAKRNLYRVSEFTLLFIGLLGGVIGSFLGMFVFHHKTRKIKFYIFNIVSLILLIWVLFMIK